jgi:hypothetical protein
MPERFEEVAKPFPKKKSGIVIKRDMQGLQRSLCQHM